MQQATGAIRNTPLQKVLKLKVSARVMLTFNIDTCDSLTNGTFGEVIGVECDEKNNVTRVIVMFDDESSGKERRKNYLMLQKKYSPKKATPIEKIEFHYSLSRNSTSASSNAVAIQFPLRLAFAATAHKIQGSTIKKPSSLVVDLRSVREAAQAYVMLSRIQALSQLFILKEVCIHKIYASQQAMGELDRLKNVSLNSTYNQFGKCIISCNIRSLSRNFQPLKSIPKLDSADVICCQETWLLNTNKCGLEIDGFQLHLNSAGRGKGVATYHKANYAFSQDVTRSNYQMTKISSNSQDIINVYRSTDAPSSQFIDDILKLLNFTKVTFIVGDLNICFNAENNHQVIKSLENLGFVQKVLAPTHMEGRLIDHVFLFSPNQTDSTNVKVVQQSSFFGDHDIIFVRQVYYIN